MRRARWRLLLASAIFTAAGTVAYGAHVEHRGQRVAVAPGGSVKCDIRSKIDGGGLWLQAIARSKETVQGEYVFTVLKQSSSGTSQNEQSGDFSIGRGGEAVLTTVMLEAAARDHYKANLTITWDHGRVSCQSPGSFDRT